MLNRYLPGCKLSSFYLHFLCSVFMCVCGFLLLLVFFGFFFLGGGGGLGGWLGVKKIPCILNEFQR